MGKKLEYRDQKLKKRLEKGARDKKELGDVPGFFGLVFGKRNKTHT